MQGFKCGAGGGGSEGLKFQIISYKGNGKYGASNPTTITFDFPPKLVGLANVLHPYGNFTEYRPIINYAMDMVTTSYKQWGNSSDSVPYVKKSADGKTLYMYVTSSIASYQNNYADYTYYWWALG